MAKDCLVRVTSGVALGAAIGGSFGAVYGTYEAIRYRRVFEDDQAFIIDRSSVFELLLSVADPEVKESRVPGLLKIRHIGQTTVKSAAVFGLFLGAGSLLHCGKS